MFSRLPRRLVAVRQFSSRSLWRWGATDAEVPEVSRTPQVLPEGANATAIACGTTHSAFVVDGQLYTYGSSRHGKLGHDGDGAVPQQVTVEASDGHRPPVNAVALGGNHSAAITEGGVLWTWGYGGSFWHGAGGCGLGRRGETLRPEMVLKPFVTQGVEVLQVACGDLHTLVLDRHGRVHSTGDGIHGVLGRGGLASMGEELDFREVVYFRKTTDSILAPGQEPQIVKLDAGRHFCAAMSSHGELWVWGRNDYGQLGMGFEVMKDRDFCMKYPFLMRHLPMEGHVFRDFACGDRHVVAVTTAGAIYEWGDRRNFEPLAITLPSRYEEGLKGVSKVAAGEGYSFALTLSGELYSWGRPSSGCLADPAAVGLPPSDGDSDGEPLVPRPRRVPPEIFGGQRVLDIAASKQRCLALTEG